MKSCDKKYLIICFICLNSLITLAHTRYSSWKGSGKAEDPFQIEDIHGLKQLVEDSKNGEYHENEYFILTADLVDNQELKIPDDFTIDTPEIDGITWDPIVRFDGHLNGNGHSISGIKGYKYDLIVGPYLSSVCFINELNGSIKNLTIKNSFMCSWIGSGGIENSTIENCVNYAVTRYGFSSSWINLLKNSGNYGKSYSCGLAGGTVRRAINCYNYGDVEAKASASMHDRPTYRRGGTGLFHEVYFAINCFNMGKVIGAEDPSGIGWIFFDWKGEESFSNIVNYGEIISMDASDTFAITPTVRYNYQTGDHKTHVGNLYSLKGSATSLIGDTKYVTFTGSHSFYSESYMKSNEFWEELNLNAIAFGSECCSWKWGKDGFPILEIIDEEAAGINDIVVPEYEDSQVPIIYYNLQGIKVKNPDKGIYIKVQGSKKEKIVFN